MMANLQRLILAFLGFLFLFTLALGVRLALLEAQYRQVGADLPFTLESALFYRRIKMVYDTGRLPAHDAMVQYPEGINPRTTYTVGAEYVYAALARLFPEHVPVAKRIRWIEAGCFSLGIPLLAWGVYGWRRSLSAALWASLFYAVSISSVLRSTGQELSHENSALPVLIAHWALGVWAKRFRRPSMRYVMEAASAALLAVALCAWDLIQFYIGLRFLVRAWRLCGASGGVRQRSSGWWFEYVALLAVGVLNPYHHAQGWLTSAPMGLVHGVMLLTLLRRGPLCKPSVSGRVLRFALLLAVMGLTAFFHQWSAAQGAYGHFAELLWAKIRYLNVKPVDPARLTFDQRILWVPALNSTDARLAFTMFPALFGLTIPAAFLLFRQQKKLRDEELGEWIFAWAVSAAAFWLFFRFHVFLSLFCCTLLGAAWSILPPRQLWVRWTAGLILGTGLFAETIHTLQRPGQWGRVNVYFKELNELTTWLERHAAPDAVLANFGVSGSIAAYGKCAIILHPKFENAGLRQQVRAYGEHLFLRTEKEFRDWAIERGAQYYVHAFGEFSRRQPELQMRYFVNALDPSPEAAARGFEFDPDGRTWFVPLWRNVKYAVFRIVSAADEAIAARQVSLAEAALQRGDLDATSRACMAALERFPRQPRALELLRIAGSLQASGFKAEHD